MSVENNSKIPEDEIDFKSIGTKILDFLRYPIKLLYSNPLIAFYFALGSVLLSVTLKYVVPKNYSASFIIKPADVHDKAYVTVLNEIPILLDKDDHKALASLLQMDSATVAELRDINIYPSLKRLGDSSTVAIVLECRDTSVIQLFQDRILNYLENNPYYLKVKKLQEAQIAMNLAEINKELAQLDSLKKLQIAQYQNQKPNSQSNLMLNDLINPTAAYHAAAERMSRKSGLLAQSAFIDRFLLIKSVVIPTRHIWPPRVLIMCLVLVPFSLILASVFLHYRAKKGQMNH